MKLHLGVLDVPYSGPANAPRRVAVRVRRGGKPQVISAPASGAETTGDVAEILEAKYHVLEIFYELNAQKIGDSIAEAVKDAFEDALSSGMNMEPTVNFTAAESAIKTEFNKFIDSKAMDGVQPGVPTAAALAGVNHRLKHPYAKGNPVRPSFKDTGLFEQSMRSWIEE